MQKNVAKNIYHHQQCSNVECDPIGGIRNSNLFDLIVSQSFQFEFGQNIVQNV